MGTTNPASSFLTRPRPHWAALLCLAVFCMIGGRAHASDADSAGLAGHSRNGGQLPAGRRRQPRAVAPQDRRRS